MSVDRIHDKSNVIVLPVVSDPVSQQGKKPGRASSLAQDDLLSISDKSREFLQVRKMVDTQPDFRLARVNSLAKAIQEGTYNVRGERIADGIIRRNLIDFTA